MAPRTRPRERKTVILLGASAGPRSGDATSVRWEMVDLVKKKNVIRPEKSRGKTREEASTSTNGTTVAGKRHLIIPLHPAIKKHLLEIASSDDPKALVTPSLAQAIPGGRSGRSRQFQDIMAKAEIAQTTLDPAAAGVASRMSPVSP